MLLKVDSFNKTVADKIESTTVFEKLQTNHFCVS